MKKMNDPFESVFHDMQDKTPLTKEQKEKMLSYILVENRLQNTSFSKKAVGWIAAYPWRFAFSIATVQTVLCTLIFGTGYTNLFLSIFGG